MGKIEIDLPDTRLEDVLPYLYNQVKKLRGKQFAFTRLVNHLNGTSNNATFYRTLQYVQPPQNNRIEIPCFFSIVRDSGEMLENYTYTAIVFEGLQRKTNIVRITAEYEDYFEPAFNIVWNDLIETFGPAPQPTPKNNEPTFRIQDRFRIFDSIKQKHPEWSQAKVAIVATSQEGIEYTAETVRNTYKSMGKKWERADRIR